jgi:hypothetical protein
MDFTLRGYAKLIAEFKGLGYQNATFHDVEPANRDLILRHDLDFSLDAAIPVGEVEAKAGFRATYFVLVRSELYNIHSPKASSVFKNLQDQGHEVGLHLDASLYGDDRNALEDAADLECGWLEDMLGTAVRTISFHRPAKSLLEDDAPLAGRIHAYQARFFKQMGYCSDSRGGWHHGTPLSHEAVQSGKALQLLTHPIWWTSLTPGDPVFTLDAFRVDRDEQTAQSLAANCEPYRTRNGAGQRDE